DRLRRHFGAEWDDYDRRVPDFIPSPVPRVRDAGRWNARLVAENSEVSAALLLLGALVLLGSRLYVQFPLPWCRRPHARRARCAHGAAPPSGEPDQGRDPSRRARRQGRGREGRPPAAPAAALDLRAARPAAGGARARLARRDAG